MNLKKADTFNFRLTHDRKFGTPVDFNAYQEWKQGDSTAEPAAAPNSETSSLLKAPASAPLVVSQNVNQTEQSSGAPRRSYQEIVDLIQSGKPIPGIKDIPKTILEGQGTEPAKSVRRKPWEKDTPTEQNTNLA